MTCGAGKWPTECYNAGYLATEVIVAGWVVAPNTLYPIGG